LNLVWLLRSQISKSAKVFLLRRSVVGCRLTRVVIMDPSRVGNAMRRNLNSVIVEEVEEAIGIIDERVTDEMTRKDLRHRRQCPQFRRLETRSLLLSRMVCPSCLLASVSRAKQQGNQDHLLHRDSAAKSPHPWVSRVCLITASATPSCPTAINFSFFVIYRIALVFWRYNPHQGCKCMDGISADLEHV
jgi:hypothetical protein